MLDARKRSGEILNGQKYVHTETLEEYIDILTGQVPLGSHELWKDENKKIVTAQYIVSLRNPYYWLISNAMDKVESEREGDESPITIDAVVEAIKEKVESSLSNNLYHEVYARYLISPSQIAWIQKEEADVTVDHRVDLSLRNLVDTNALVVIAEEMPESMEKLQYVFDPNGDRKDIVHHLLEETQPQTNNATISFVETILQSLKEDTSGYQKLGEYLKYEMKIYEQAKEMHKRQLTWVRERRPAPT